MFTGWRLSNRIIIDKQRQSKLKWLKLFIFDESIELECTIWNFQIKSFIRFYERVNFLGVIFVTFMYKSDLWVRLSKAIIIHLNI